MHFFYPVPLTLNEFFWVLYPSRSFPHHASQKIQIFLSDSKNNYYWFHIIHKTSVAHISNQWNFQPISVESCPSYLKSHIYLWRNCSTFDHLAVERFVSNDVIFFILEAIICCSQCAFRCLCHTCSVMVKVSSAHTYTQIVRIYVDIIMFFLVIYVLVIKPCLWREVDLYLSNPTGSRTHLSN